MRALVITLLCWCAGTASANILENPSFEVGSGNSAAGWDTDIRSGRYEFLVDPNAHSGRRCVAIQGTEAGVARWYTTDPFLIAGNRYRLSCWVRGDGPVDGRVWLPGGGVTLSFGHEPQWKRVEAEFSPQNTGRHGLYLQCQGTGTAYFDDVELTLVEAKPALGSGAIPTNGAPLTQIVVPDDANAAEGYLAIEARRILKEITGVELPVVAHSAATEGPGRSLCIGRAADVRRYARDLAKVGEEGIVLDIGPKAIACLGNTPRGTFYAVHEFFHLLGCRWYMPWEGGECLPRRQKLALPRRKIVHKPSFILRGGKTIQVYHYPPAMTPEHVDTERWVDWAARNRMNGLRAGYPQMWRYGSIRGGEYHEFAGHTLYAVLPPDRFFATHPEFYTLVKGERTATHSSGRPSQVCIANEEVIRRIADHIIEWFDSHPTAGRFGVCAEDEPSYWCECAQCKALDTAPGIDWSKNGEGVFDLTDRWIWFINRIAERVAQKHPDKWIHTFAYGSTREVPRKYFPHENVMIELTWWDRCFKHRSTDRKCEINRKGMERLAAWSKLAPIAVYGYLDFHQQETPQSFALSDAEFYPEIHRRGVRYVSDEWDATFLSAPLLFNLRARLLWDVKTDVKRYIDEFCQAVYGPAAAPVKAYFLGLERAVAQAPSEHVSFNNLERFTPAVVKQAHAHLDAADRLAGDDATLRTRLARLRLSLKYAEVCLLAKRVEKEPALYADLTRLKREVDGLVKQHNIPILIMAYNLLDMKYQPPVAALAGRRLLQLPEQWLFRPDPNDAGEGERWFAQTSFADWKPISIHSPWEEQGYPGMDGDGWYALKVPLPAADAERVYLLFEAVDETFKLWINGEYVGQSEGDPGVLWDKPQAVEITGKFRPGAENVIVVKVHDVGYAGGIWKPVWLTAAAKGDAVIGAE